jgi:hypothetical protein
VARIIEPVIFEDVQFNFSGQFCEHEAMWKDSTRICLAHLDRGRIFTCEKMNMTHAKSDPGYCADAESPRNEAGKEKVK